MALAALEVAHAVRAALPKCGAKRKRDGQPCRQLALENGRCKFHGGRTPAGDGWHRPRVPAKGEVGGIEAYEAKLAVQEKRKAQRRRKLAAMTIEERQRYEAWLVSHAPGPASGRANRRQPLGTKAMLNEILAASDRRAGEERRERALRTEASRERERLDERAAKRPTLQMSDKESSKLTVLKIDVFS